MRPGLVVNIRVNPKDCVAVLDVMDAAETIHMAGSSIKPPVIQCPFEHVEEEEEPKPAVVEELTTEMRVARRDLTALIQKQDMAEDGTPGITWGDSDEQEYNRLIRTVYPDG